MNLIWQSARMVLALTLATGVVYPLAVTAIGQLLFPVQAGGSLIDRGGVIVGSGLIGQSMKDPRYFQPRPSATGYNPLPSGGSNQGATSRGLQVAAAQRIAALRAANPAVGAGVLPADLVWASASGLDPHISPGAARLQVDRIVEARGFDASRRAELESLIDSLIEPATFGFLGVPRINVLALNLALDDIQ